MDMFGEEDTSIGSEFHTRAQDLEKEQSPCAIGLARGTIRDRVETERRSRLGKQYLRREER